MTRPTIASDNEEAGTAEPDSASGPDGEADPISTPAVANDDNAGDAVLQGSPLRLTWVQVTDQADVQLPSNEIAVNLVNDSEQELSVDLDWIGDLGTTRTFRGTLDPVVLAPLSELEVEIDVGALFPTLDTTYSGHLQLSGHVTASGGTVSEAISPGVYFHRHAGQVLAYPESLLRGGHRAGDIGALHPETAALLVPGSDAGLVRVVEYEPEPDDAAELALSPVDEPAAAGATMPALLDPSGTQHASYAQVLCVKFQVKTVDSGYTNSVGIKEDHWNTANAAMRTPAVGVRVDVGASTYDTSASTGCVIFFTPSPTYATDVRVYAYSTDASDNFVRMHNGPSDTQQSDPAPGQTYSILVSGVTFTKGINTILNVGSYTPRWTAMGALAFSLMRYNDGLYDSGIHVSDLGGENPVNPNHCAANFSYYTDPAANTSFIRLITTNAICPKHDQNVKFLVSHELGHAYGYLRGGVTGQSPADTTHDVEPSACPPGNMGDPYGNRTKEWSSIAVREGFAHFYSARVWNDAAADGQFQWDESFDLERYAAADLDGGYLVNLCCLDGLEGTPAECAASLDGAGTLADWMRAFWDQHTDGTCSTSKFGIGAIYGATVSAAGLTEQNFWDETQTFMTAYGPTCAARWDANGCHNGIDRRGALWSGC